MKSALFDYELPKELIAHKSVRPRDHSRLMVLDRKRQAIAHHGFFEIGKFLHPGDLLVVNDTKVFKARIFGAVGKRSVELLLLHPESSTHYYLSATRVSRLPSISTHSRWLCLGKPGRRLRPGTEITFGRVRARVLNKDKEGKLTVQFSSVRDVVAWANRVGHVPVPPYVRGEPKRFEDYQTVYAKKIGSVAAPTAGFHFTSRLIRELKKKGIGFAEVTLHVGLGTFRPIVTDQIEEHLMHEEYAEIPRTTMRAIQAAKVRGGRVIAVGTTTVRALEGLITDYKLLTPRQGCRGSYLSLQTNLFIQPGYRFKIIDGLITNFHLPKSTLLVLVSAFAGRLFMLRAYNEAMRRKYRFYSFGDAMLIL